MRRYLITIQRIPRHPPVVTDPQNPSYSVRVIGSEVSAGLHDVYAEIRYRETQRLVPAGVLVAATVTDGNASFWAGGETSIQLDTHTDGTTKYTDVESQRVQFDPATGVTVRYIAPDGSFADYTVEGTGSGTPDYDLAAVGGPFSGETNSTIQVVVNVTDAVTTNPVQNVAVAIASGYPTPSGSATGATTDGSGNATINWTLGATEDTYTLRVTTPDSGDTLDINATATAPVSEDYTLTVENGPFSGTYFQSVQVQVKVVSANTGDPVAGASVSPVSGYPRLSVSGTASGSCTSGVTNSSGIATLNWTLGNSEEEHTLRCETASTGDFVDTTADVTAPATGSSPHYTHMRFAGIDYRLNDGTPPHRYNLSPAQWAAEMDWWTSIADGSINGYVPGLLSRNPTFKPFMYMHSYCARLDQSVGLLIAQEQWATQNGYNWEDFFLHHGAGQQVIAYTDHEGNAISAHTATGTKIRADRVVREQYAGEPFWYYNMGHAGFRQWMVTVRVPQVIAGGAAGCFLDSNSRSAIGKHCMLQSTVEYANYAAYEPDHLSLLSAMADAVPAGYNLPNQSQYINKANEHPIALACRGTMTEYNNASHRKPYWEELSALIAQGVTVFFSGQANDKFHVSQFGENAGNYADLIERRQLWNYASYLMIVDPNNMDRAYFENYIESYPTPTTDRTVWMDAFAYDIGLATGNRAVLPGFSGTDGSGSAYKVWRRNFQNAVVLIRRAEPSFSATGMGDASAVTIDLTTHVPGTWQLLRENGPGATVTSIQLRGGEAAILIDAS